MSHNAAAYESLAQKDDDVSGLHKGIVSVDALTGDSASAEDLIDINARQLIFLIHSLQQHRDTMMILTLPRIDHCTHTNTGTMTCHPVITGFGPDVPHIGP